MEPRGLEPERDSPQPRRPGTAARVLFLAASVAGFALLFGLGFPPGVPDRLPVLAIALTLAVACAQRPAGGVLVFCFLFPCAGLLARIFGGSEPSAWPVLLFAGLATGWTFRFVYDFESRPEPSRAGAPLSALLALWSLSLLVAVGRARTLWALLRGLSGRAVNGDGLTDGGAIRESVFAFSMLAAGAGFFFLMRRAGPLLRRRALAFAVCGIAVSGLAAGLERLGVLPGRGGYWALTRRASGAAVDPNSLGLLCGLGLAAAVVLGSSGGARPLRGALAGLPLALGLFLSGSRSGLVVAAGGLVLAVFSSALPRGLRVLSGSLAAALLLATALLILAAPAGTVGGRLAQSFDADLPVQLRASARPLLWRAAARLFRHFPLVGGGVGSFAWSLPDLLREDGASLPIRDNPGSAYLQAASETGLTGLAGTLLFLVVLGREAWRRLRSPDSPPAPAAAALSVLPFFAALGVGSHWEAGDTSLFFFLLASLAVASRPTRLSPAGRTSLAAVVAFAVAGTIAVLLGTARADAAFRYSDRIGVHAAEHGSGGTYHWTRRNFALRVPPRSARRIGLANFSPEGRPVRLTVSSGGRPLSGRGLSPGGAVLLRLVNPSRKPAVLRFSLSRSFVPKHLGIPGDDRRELGVQAVFPDG